MTRRRLAFAFAAVAIWTAGSALGSVGPVSPAQAHLASLVIGKAHADFTPSLSSSKPIFVLVLGSDARPGTPVARGLSDSIHILAINLKKQTVTILGFPRDSWVVIPGFGTDKINSAMARGGPALTIRTIEQLTGIKLDYYVLTSFAGVTNAVNVVGGLTIDVPFPMHDSDSRANFGPGIHHLSGGDVLAFARDRHSLITGDFGRSEDQGRVLIALLEQVRKQFAQDPGQLFTYVGAGMRNVQTDLTLDQVLKFSFTALSIDPST